MIVSELRSSLFALLGVLAFLYYVNLLTSKPDADESRTIRILAWFILSPSPARVAATVQRALAQIFHDRMAWNVQVDYKLLRALEDCNIQPIRICQARQLKYIRILAGMLLASSAMFFLSKTYGLNTAMASKISLFGFTFTAFYDLYLSMRLDMYINEHENVGG